MLFSLTFIERINSYKNSENFIYFKKQNKKIINSKNNKKPNKFLSFSKNFDYKQLMTEKVLSAAKRACSSPSDVLRKEFDQLDQQYSYEHAVVRINNF